MQLKTQCAVYAGPHAAACEQGNVLALLLPLNWLTTLSITLIGHLLLLSQVVPVS
jgi:hypothetical protein